MRRKLQTRKKGTSPPALRLQAVGLAAVLLLPWLATVIALPGVAVATGTTDATNTAGGATAGFPPGYSTCPQKLTYVGWVELQSQGERTRSPLSNPGTICLSDGYVSYDTDLYVILSPTPGAPSLVGVVVEQWTPGTVTTYVNVTGSNGTVSVVPEQTPIQLDPQWSNGTAALIPGEQAGLIIPLPNSNGSYLPMVVTIDNTTWHLVHISPPQSSFAVIYGEYGLNMTLEIFGLLLGGFILLLLIWAKNFARKYHHIPKVPHNWWPWAVIGSSGFAFFSFYIPFNQILGALGPILLPGIIVLAAAPYAPRLFEDAEMCLIVSYHGESQRSQWVPHAILPLVRKNKPITCAPETWSELVHCAWPFNHPMPSVAVRKINKNGEEVLMEPDPMEVKSMLGEYYDTDAKLFLWARSTVPVTRVRHHFARITVMVPKEVEGDDGKTVTRMVPKRTIWPRTVLGSLQIEAPRAEDMLRTRAGTESLERATDRADILQAVNARLLGRRADDRAQARDEEASEMMKDADAIDKIMSPEDMEIAINTELKRREDDREKGKDA